MKTFEELYKNILEDSQKHELYDELKIDMHKEYDPAQLNCLFNPSNHPVTWDIDKVINEDGTTKEGEVISKDALTVIKELYNNKDKLAYVIIAPAFLGQFEQHIAPGMLRNTFKAIGFDGMVEAAIFADILTLKEALEFDQNILTEQDYQLTSCCCPMWISMIKQVYSDLMPHVPATVSPMIAAGRTIKILHPNSFTVFVGPCVAKKAEARDPELAGAIDHVLTFQETKEIFDILNVKPSEMEDSVKEFSSRAGRIYAVAGGVSEAVRETVERLNPGRRIKVRAKTADGVMPCKEMLNELKEGRSQANFFEGMGCVGGCVGGPKSIIDKGLARYNVNTYGEKATYQTPIDNPYVLEVLKRLGFDTPESLMSDNKFFTRKF